MKKRIAVFFLILAFACGAASADEYRATLGNTPIFHISYDEKVYTIDTQSMLDGNDEAYTWLFTLESGAALIDCAVEYAPSLSDFSLFLKSEDEIRRYADEVCESFKQYGCRYVKTYALSVSNGAKTATLPFIMLQMTDDMGVSLHAETVSHGYIISFEIFDSGAARTADEKMKTLLEILDTFTPIG